MAGITQDTLAFLTATGRREIDNLLFQYSVFRKTYYDDPVGFVHDCIEWFEDEPSLYQDEIIAGVNGRKRVAVRGPHGLGKTAVASWVVLWFALTRDVDDDWKIPMTASAWRQLSKFLLPEIHKWARRIRWDSVGRDPFDPRTELMTLNLRLSTGEAFALASNQADLIEGAHADSLLYIFDEAKMIPDATWNSAEGAFASGDCYFLAISTPGEPQGEFYDIHSRKPGYEDWWVRHVTLDEAIASGRISRQWADQRKRQWGKESAVYQNRVLGEFASNDSDGVIPLAWVELANERWAEWVEAGKPGDFTGVGVDVGGGGESGDKTVMAPCYDGVKIDALRKYPRGDPNTATMETAGRIKGILDGKGGKAVIDVIGIGTGVVHRLREQGYKATALAFNAAEGTKHRDISGELGFKNKRAAGWWITRELLDPANDHAVALPPDDELTGDLTAPKYKVLSGGKIQVEGKESIRKRLGRSTDCGDAVIQILAIQLVKRGILFG